MTDYYLESMRNGDPALRVEVERLRAELQRMTQEVEKVADWAGFNVNTVRAWRPLVQIAVELDFDALLGVVADVIATTPLKGKKAFYQGLFDQLSNLDEATNTVIRSQSDSSPPHSKWIEVSTTERPEGS
jgi:hypothetical protein